MRLAPPHFLKWALLCMIALSIEQAAAGSKKVVNFQPSMMSTDDVIAYFTSFFAKASSLDGGNERFYQPEDYPEDLYHKIENLMPLEYYVRWLMKTKDITDKTGERKVSLLPQYGGVLNHPCNPLSIFSKTIQNILRIWDGERSIVTHELEEWLRLNEFSQPFELCNRFRGLMCKHKLAENPDEDQGRAIVASDNSTCQCGGDPFNVGFFKQPVGLAAKEGLSSYPDGCYVRAWRPCKHLSDVDDVFQDGYKEWHGSLENQRRILAQMVFPVARTHRCKQGTYCLDMIPGMKKPVCWCSVDAEDEECKIPVTTNSSNESSGFVPPLGSELSNIRKSFVKLIIPASDMRTICNPEYNKEVLKLVGLAGKNPTQGDAVEIMRKLSYAGRTVRICDFREAIVCDAKTRTCRGNLNCGPGKIHLGKGVCVSDNGHQCQSNEDCVQNARCTFFKEVSASACVCETGYGDECQLQHRPFFGSRFLPMVSGFQGEEYIKLQVEMFKILESWEDSMKLKVGERCDPLDDQESMELVDYFGTLSLYKKEDGEALLGKAKKMMRDGSGPLCLYSQFQHCDGKRSRCAPFMGKGIVSTTDSQGRVKFMVELDAEMDCAPNIPKIFRDMVTLVCGKGYACDFRGHQKLCVPDCSSPFAPKKDCEMMKVGVRVKGRQMIQRFDYDGDEGQESPVVAATTIKSKATAGATKGRAAAKGRAIAPMVNSKKEANFQRKKTAAAAKPPAFSKIKSAPAAPARALPIGRQNPPPVNPAPGPPPDNLDCEDDDCEDDDCEDANDEKDDCEDANDKVGSPLGAPCKVREDCDTSNFIDCSTSQKQYEIEGTCVCMLGLVASKIRSACEIQYDEYCSGRAVDKLNALGYSNVTDSPECFSGECSIVNKAEICRPVDEDGAGFISREKMEKLRELSGSRAVIRLPSALLLASCLGLGLGLSAL